MLNDKMCIKFLYTITWCQLLRRNCVVAQTCPVQLPAPRWGLIPACNGGKHLRAAPCGGGCWVGKLLPTTERLLPPQLLSATRVEKRRAVLCRACIEVWVPCLEVTFQALLVPSPSVTRDQFPPQPGSVGAVPCLGLSRGGDDSHVCWAPSDQLLLTVISALHGNVFTSFLKKKMLSVFS